MSHEEPCARPESRAGLRTGLAVVPSRREAEQLSRAELATRGRGFVLPPIRWLLYEWIEADGERLYGCALTNRKSYSILIAANEHPRRDLWRTALHELAHVICETVYRHDGCHDGIFWAIYHHIADAYTEHPA